MTKDLNKSLAQGAQVRFALAGIIFVALAVFVVWPSYQDFVAKRAKLAELKNQIEQTETELEGVRGEYRTQKTSYAKRVTQESAALAKVFPNELEQTNITRAFEEYANLLAGAGEAFLLKSVSFGRALAEKDAEYAKLPIRVSVNTSKENLSNLLKYIESTGKLEAGSAANRLLSTQDISIQINEETRPEAGIFGKIDADITLDAYAAPTAAPATN